MLDRVLKRDEFDSLVNELALTHRIVGPVRRDGHSFYEIVDRAAEIDFEFRHCVYSPKAYLLPPKEELFTFDWTNGRFESKPRFDTTPLAIVGVHPCDLHAIQLLDHVFASAPADQHYLARRSATVLIGIECWMPCTDGAFCKEMGTNQSTGGFDLMLYPLGGADSSTPASPNYGVSFGSQRGREIIEQHRVGRGPTGGDEAEFVRLQQAKSAAFARTIPETVETLPALLDRSYDSLLWEATARRCYSCGSCNLVCPTCYCFDMHDATALDALSGKRVREWDGCQLSGFAEVAGGHNFRANASSRLRHRVYRKGKWIRQHTGLPGCVGCGRCDRACTAKISLAEIFRQLSEEG